MSSEGEDDAWDEDCVVGQIGLDKESHLLGFQPRNYKELVAPPPKKMQKICPILRSSLTEDGFVATYGDAWRNQKEIKTNGVETINSPYQVSVVQNFLQNEDFVRDMLLEFNEISWNKKNVDLFEFYQSYDLKHVDCDLPCIRAFYDFLKQDVMPWVEKITGIELTRVAATCSVYGDTDYLLVHDDLQDHRAIAFVYYLNGYGEWKPSYGGSLQLIDIAEATVLRDILPCNNQFLFFKVSKKSFHQVEEVTNKSTCRLSINGWFHNKKRVVSAKHVFYEPENVPTIPPAAVSAALEQEIAPSYIEDDLITEIQQQIEEHSEISLANYFNQEKFDEYVSILRSDSMEWVLAGPLSRRNYEIASENLPQGVQALVDIFKSEQMFALLKRYSDLELTSMRYELQRWRVGCYSLLTDFTSSDKKELDVILFLGCEDGVIGGQIMYVVSEQLVQEAIITIEPKDNQLNIVYRDTGRFTKYVSKYSKKVPYYMLVCSYTEDE